MILINKLFSQMIYYIKAKESQKWRDFVHKSENVHIWRTTRVAPAAEQRNRRPERF